MYSIAQLLTSQQIWSHHTSSPQIICSAVSCSDHQSAQTHLCADVLSRPIETLTHCVWKWRNYSITFHQDVSYNVLIFDLHGSSSLFANFLLWNGPLECFFFFWLLVEINICGSHHVTLCIVGYSFKQSLQSSVYSTDFSSVLVPQL